ncbi:hypothetical protein LTR66_000970 [Elasticomyces elasticus]|nr:hypothetical protein LTR66_000970 [Elasticomyces elasticus]
MFSRTPKSRERGGAASYKSLRRTALLQPETARRKGLFANGTWQCDCLPSLPAEHFKVKKEGRNQGRWFYTCQKPAERGCGFFLWDEDAKLREEAAVLSNSRNEPKITPSPTASKRKSDALAAHSTDPRVPSARVSRVRARSPSLTASPSPPPPYVSQRDVVRGFKRTAQAADLASSDDEFSSWLLTGQDVDELIKSADAATPRKAMKMDAHATPATSGKRKLPWLHEQGSSVSSALSSPGTLLNTPSKPPTARIALPTPNTTESIGLPLQCDAQTPTPIRFRDATSGDSATLATDIAAIFSNTNTSSPSMVRARLMGAARQHDLKMKGVIKGRDASRAALVARDRQIASLQARVAALEAELGISKTATGSLRSERLRRTG